MVHDMLLCALLTNAVTVPGYGFTETSGKIPVLRGAERRQCLKGSVLFWYEPHPCINFNIK